MSSIALYFSYVMGTGMNYLWWLIQPVLFLGGALLLVNTYMRVDPSFKSRFGDLTKPTKRTIWLILIDLLIIVIIYWISGNIFDVTLSSGENIGTITRVAGIGFYEITIFWLLVHFNILIVFTALNVIVLIGIYLMKRSHPGATLFYSILFVIPLLINLLGLQSIQELFTPQERFIITLLLILVFFWFPFTLSVVILKLTKSKDYIKSRAALIPWILFVGMFLAVIKVAPSVLVLEGRVKSLSNWFDLIGLLFTLFFGIIRVTTVSERPELKTYTKSRNLLKWIKQIRIPAYSRVLIMFYLAFIGFYLTLESHTVSVLLSIPNEFRVLRLRILAFTSSFGFLYVFWRYKPLKQITESRDKTDHEGDLLDGIPG